MSEFKRGLTDDFVCKLNDLYGQEKSWWKELVDDPDTFVAIRDNYVNVYYQGASLALVQPSGSGVAARVHYKYLLDPEPWRDDEYVRVGKDGEVDWGRLGRESFPMDRINVRALKAAAENYAGEEKTGVHEIIRANHNILDVEIAIGQRGTAAKAPSAPRIDFAALHVSEAGPEVVFYEAKTFANHKALRARGAGKPEVISQIRTYEQLLKDNRSSIEKSYEHVCRNLRALSGIRERNRKRYEMLENVAGKPLTIDEEPKLVVFGFDNDQRVGKTWEPHRKKLEDKLSCERVLLKGDSKDFRNGISSRSAAR